MAAPGSLFGEGAQLTESGAASARKVGDQNIERQKIASTEAQNANSELGAGLRQMSPQQAAMALQKESEASKLRGEIITVTPQLALGLVKNTGDKSWLEYVGQDIRSDVYTSLYTHGMALEHAKRAPTPVKRYLNGKEQTGISWIDENGVNQEWFGTGMTPTELNPPKQPGKDPESIDFKNKKEFNRAYEKLRTEYSKPIDAKLVKDTNPDKYAKDMQWLADKKNQYDTNVIEMSKGGKNPAAAGASPLAKPAATEKVFNADAELSKILGGE